MSGSIPSTQQARALSTRRPQLGSEEASAAVIPEPMWAGRLCRDNLHIHHDHRQFTGAGHIIGISGKSGFLSVIPFKKGNVCNAYIQFTQTDTFQVFISFHVDDYN